MNNQSSQFYIDQDQYYKLYIQQRQNLHSSLIKQLLTKSELRKQDVLQVTSDMIEKFLEYRDTFLTNMPQEILKMPVREYMSKYNGNFFECMKHMKTPEMQQIEILSEQLNQKMSIQNFKHSNTDNYHNGHQQNQREYQKLQHYPSSEQYGSNYHNYKASNNY